MKIEISGQNLNTGQSFKNYDEENYKNQRTNILKEQFLDL